MFFRRSSLNPEKKWRVSQVEENKGETDGKEKEGGRNKTVGMEGRREGGRTV